MNPLVVALTGASGSIYAVRLLEVLLAAGRHVHLTFSPAAAEVFRHELGVKLDPNDFNPSQLLPSADELAQDSKLGAMQTSDGSNFAVSSVLSDTNLVPGRITYHHYMDFHAGIASGSFLTDGMVICPCSMGTLAGVAHGLSQNLIQRAADVHLKERRKLVVVPRETPLGLVQLDNMRRLAEAGGVVLPASPAFYHGPVTIHDLIDFVVGRICDQLGVQQNLFRRWGEEET